MLVYALRRFGSALITVWLMSVLIFVLVRMVVNALIDALIGAIPVAGNIGDIFWRANNLNLALLERHSRPGRPPTPGDYAFVWLIALALGLLILVPVLIALWLATVMWHLVAGR